MATGKLVVLGSINVDHILNVEQFPHPGETVFGEQYKIAFGGKGANQAVAAARSGADVTFIACVGEDEIGERVRQQLEMDRIDVQSIGVITQKNTGVALIFVNTDGENVIGVNAGANAAVTPDYLKRHQQKVIDADFLLMQLETPLETIISAAQLAKQHNTYVILNPAPACELPDELLAMIDMITPNETETQRLTGITVTDNETAKKAAHVLHDKGVRRVIITLGSRGVWLSDNGQGQLVPSFKVQAVDTIAAGDTFNGALVTALLEKKSLHEAVFFAHAAAAIAVTREGAHPSVPWRKEIDTFLKQNKKAST